jgi:hypothetical protein
VAKILAKRFRYREVTAAQWLRLDEIVDNEFPIGTAKGRDRAVAWQWLADLMADLARDAGDPIEAAFDEVNRLIGERKAAADADEQRWQVDKEAERRAAAASPIVAQLAAGGIGPGIARQSAVTHDKAIAQLRRVRGQLNGDAWQALLERYGVTEAELDEPELQEAAHG